MLALQGDGEGWGREWEEGEGVHGEGVEGEGGRWGVTFSLDIRPIFSFALSFPILIQFCYHMQILWDCLIPISLSLITPIVDRPLYYLVAVCLLPYLCQDSYLV